MRRPRKMAAAAERMKIFIGTLNIWLISVVLGIIVYEGRPGPMTPLPLKWYDNLVRRIGPLLPLLVVGVRLIALMCPIQRWSQSTSKPSATEIGLVYIGITILRVLIYLLHLGVEGSSLMTKMPSWIQGDGQLMSDHIVLGASMICILQIEAVFFWREYETRRRAGYRRLPGESQPQPWRLIVVAFAFVLACVLFGLTCADMYYTARHFHPRFQSSLALSIGFFVFQVPSAIWVYHRL
ncbi:hypothetical protein BSKO_08465 [Bryopsis sp. KO-2023]|nr:hypothetical protein BSKO_08465 [Bryopsis sp. KO-2023]